MNMIALLLSALALSLSYASSYDESVCAYNVKVSNARELPDEDADTFGWFGSKNLNDVYCEVDAFAKGSDGAAFKSVRTRTIDETENPQWDETFVFANNDPECGGANSLGYDRVHFKLYDDDTVGGWTAFGVLDPDFLGETETIYLSEVADCSKEYGMELQVTRDGNKGGTLFVVMTKTAACCSSSAPAPNTKYEDNSNDKKEDDDIKKLEEQEKKIEEEIKYEEQKKEEEEKYEEEKAVEEVVKGKGGGGKNKRLRRLLSTQ